MRRPALLLSLLVIASTASFAQIATETVLYAFCADLAQGCPDGVYPGASLVQAWDGNLYGSTGGGGTLPPNTLSGGTLFRITQGGALTQLDTFLCNEAVVCTGGNSPGALLVASDGNFYGTTDLSDGNGYGTFFKMAPSGAVTVLHIFCLETGCPDGEHPDAPLIEGSDGNFYGTTTNYYDGEDNSDNATGSVFKITPTGTLTTLHSFCAGFNTCTDGAYPSGNLVQGSDGNFYGTTVEGGANSVGTFFQVTLAGGFKTIYSFGGQAGSGAYPLGGLVESSDSNFYGTTSAGGANSGASSSTYSGTVFKITPAGAITTIYNFCAHVTGSNPITCLDGSEPLSGLFLGSDGNFYGNTFYGGTVYDANICYGCGTVFQVTPAGALTTLYSFCMSSMCPDGSMPMSSVLQGSDGNFYGSTFEGGNDDGDAGVLYKITPESTLAAPLQASLSSSSIMVGTPVTLTWKALNAFSTTMQQCYGFVTGHGVTTALGKLAGTYNSGTHLYSGSVTFTSTSQGSYNYALTCGGIESAQAVLTVNGYATTTFLPNDPYSTTIGQPVTITAMVAHSSGTATPTGKVTFDYEGTALATKPLAANGNSSFTASTATLPPGTYHVTATYSGDANYLSSTSGPETIILTKAPTTATLTASPNPVTPPAKCTLKATVKRSASGAAGFATGSVTFSVGTTVIGTANLSPSGVATLAAATGGITPGNYPVTAKYNGDGSDTASTSAAVDAVVE